MSTTTDPAREAAIMQARAVKAGAIVDLLIAEAKAKGVPVSEVADKVEAVGHDSDFARTVAYQAGVHPPSAASWVLVVDRLRYHAAHADDPFAGLGGDPFEGAVR